MVLKEDGTKQILNHMKVLRDKENILEKDVENKIESEVATDFSEASTPEFQQTIDDIKNDLISIKEQIQSGVEIAYTIIKKEDFMKMNISEINQISGMIGIKDGYRIYFIEASDFYFDPIPLIPVLTSNTGKNGNAFCPLSSPLYNGSNSSNIMSAYYAFNENDLNYLQYYGENQSGAWCRYDFNEPIYLKCMTAKIGHFNASNTFNYYLQYLDSNEEWVTIGNGEHTGETSIVKHELDSVVTTSSIRFYSTTTKTSGTNIFLYQLQAYGWQQNMTI